MSLFRFNVRSLLVNLDTRAQLIIIGIVVGIVSGLAAVGLNFSLKHLTTFFVDASHSWIVVGLPCLGMILTVVFLKYLVRDFGGHGVPEVIYSVDMRGGRLKLRSSISKLIGSLFTIACGGSAGPEAPVVISGAAIGSNIATYFKANERIRVAVVGSGAAAAIASIFNAPIAGVMFTMEVIIGEWSSMNLLPVAIASVTGTVISRLFQGNQIPFKHRAFEIGLKDIIASVGLALFSAFFALMLIKLLRFASKTLRVYLRNDLLRATTGGILVGAIILFFPSVKGEGYHVVRHMIEEGFSGGLEILLVIIFMKIAATSLTIGGGGAGGVFAPSLVIGSLCGFFYYKAVSVVFPQIHFVDFALFPLVGMAGVLSGTLQAPLSGIFLILEITGGYDAILPLLVVSFLTVTLVKLVEKHSIYHYELVEKGMLLRPRTDARILSDLQVEELLEKDCLMVYPEMTLRNLIPVIRESRRNYFPVQDRETKKFLGMVFLGDLKEFLFKPELLHSIIVEEVMKPDILTVSLHDSMVDILKKFDRTDAWSLPVVDEDRFIGLISKATLLDHYRKELITQTDL